MAAIGFDTLKFARKLKAAGVPDQQAEAQAEIMSEAFLMNMDALVTKDYLDARLAEHGAHIDTRFAEQDARIDTRFAEQDARIDTRFAEQEARFDARVAEQDARIETRFAEQEVRFDARFTEQDARLGARFAAHDTRLAQIDGKFRLVMWMLAVIMASTVVPAIHQLLS